MRNKGIFILLAVFPLIAWSCSKAGIVQEEIEAPVTQADPWTVIPSEKSFVGTGSLTVGAEFASETKSQLVNVGTTHASVSWTSGDQIEMSNATEQYAVYTASENGTKVSFSGGGAISGGGPYVSIYPAESSALFSTYNDKRLFGVTIPNKQTATVGSVAEEANISFAVSNTQSEDLHFKNLVSIIKFKLEGDLVSSVKHVKFNGSACVSGTVPVQLTAEGTPEILSNLSFDSPNDKYTSVSLDGDFEAGKDYYVAVAPGVHSGFSMTFSNSDGSQKLTKYATNDALTLNRSHITDFGTINIGSSFAPPATADLYIEHTTTGKYATIAVIPDGYTSEQLSQFVLDARAGIDALFNTEPFKSYKSYFNVWILQKASNESGARISDSANESERNRDCFFQSSWKANEYDNMSANSYRVFQFVKENCPDVYDGSHDIKNVPVLLIINDIRYGGIAWNYSDGATYCMVPITYGRGSNTISWSYPSKEPASLTATSGLHELTDDEWTALGGTKVSEQWKTNVGNWCNTLVHEFGGHSIGKLADEYWYWDKSSKAPVEEIDRHSWDVPMSLNVSAKSGQSQTPWAELFNSTIQSEMQTRCNNLSISNYYSQRIGVFQGADVSTFNRWRSEKISCMIDNRFYFSTWQRYLIVNRIMTLAGLSKLTVSQFLNKDNPRDPIRDGSGGSTVMRPVGVSDIVPPRPVPMLPPPRYVDKPAL